MPATTLLDIPHQEQAQMLAALRRARYGYLLALHILLLCAAGHTPTAIAAVLFCSRSNVYRTVLLYRAGQLGLTRDADGHRAALVRTTTLLPMVQRSSKALLKASPRGYGWCRTRWSCATLAAQLTAKHGLAVSPWTVRRWLHELGWVWKRAKLVAKDDDSQRVEHLARSRWQFEHWGPAEVLVFADELDIHVLPKVGAAWMPKGTQEAMMTPGKNEKYSLAGALNLATGTYCIALALAKPMCSFVTSCVSWISPTQRHRSPVSLWWWIMTVFIKPKLSNSGWRITPALPYCGYRKRKRLRDVVRDVEQYLRHNGPWLYQLSRVYEAPEVTAAVERIIAESQEKMAA